MELKEKGTPTATQTIQGEVQQVMTEQTIRLTQYYQK